MKWVPAILLVPALAIGFGGCGPAPEARQGGVPRSVFRMAIPIEVPHWDPARAEDALSADLLRQILQTLTEYTESGQVRPGLAASWKAAKDWKSIVFQLADARFSDGSPVTAEDVKASLDRARDPAVTPSIQEDKLGSIAEVRVLDPKTVEIRLKQADGAILGKLAHPVAAILPARFRNQKIDTPTQLIGSGAFQLETFVVGSGFTLKARDPKARIKSVEVQVAEPSTALTLFRTGKVDYVEALSSQSEDIATAEEYAGYRRPSARRSVLYLQLSAKAEPALRNPKFRQALACAVNRDRIARDLNGGASPRADSLSLTSGRPYPYPFDLGRAKMLLGEALGGRKSPTLVLGVHERNAGNAALAAVATDWQMELGVPVRVRAVPGGEFMSAVLGKRLPVAFTGWTFDVADPAPVIQALLSTHSDQNTSGLPMPEVDRWLAKATGLQGEARMAALGDAEESGLRAATVIPLIEPKRWILLSQRFVRVEMTPFGLGSLARTQIRRGR